MTLAQMRLEVRRALQEMEADFFTDAEITSWLNEGAKLMTKIAKQMQGVIIVTPALIGATTMYQTEYALDDDVDEVFSVFIEDGANNPRELPRREFKILHGSDSSAGTPSLYYLRTYTREIVQHTTTGLSVADINATSGDSRIVIGFYPRPSTASKLIYVYYYPRHYTMSSDSDYPVIPVEYRRGLVHYANYLGFTKDGAPADADREMASFQSYCKEMKATLIDGGGDTGFPRVLCDEDEGYDSPSVGWLT